jgi:hypothetical protein
LVTDEPRPTLASLGEGSLGVWTHPQALQVCTRHVIQRRVHEGTWQVVFRGVFADGGYVLTAEQRALAVVLAVGGTTVARDVLPRVVACGRDAARVWELPLIDDDGPATGAAEHLLHDVHATSGLGRRRGPVSEQPRRTLTPHRLDLAVGDVVRRESGLWVTTPLRTAWDNARLLSHEALVCLLDAGLHKGLFTPDELLALATRRAGVPGANRFRAAVLLADGRAEAPTETLARLLLKPLLPGLEPQVKVVDRFGRVVARFDLGDEAAKLAVDMDGKRGHAGMAMVAKDRQRDRRTESFGWWTERGTWFDVRRRQDDFVGRVVRRHGQLLRPAA